MSETGHEPVSFPDRIIFPSVQHELGRCKQNIELAREKWLLTQQDSDLGLGVSVVDDRKKTWTFWLQGSARQ